MCLSIYREIVVKQNQWDEVCSLVLGDLEKSQSREGVKCIWYSRYLSAVEKLLKKKASGIIFLFEDWFISIQLIVAFERGEWNGKWDPICKVRVLWIDRGMYRVLHSESSGPEWRAMDMRTVCRGCEGWNGEIQKDWKRWSFESTHDILQEIQSKEFASQSDRWIDISSEAVAAQDLGFAYIKYGE